MSAELDERLEPVAEVIGHWARALSRLGLTLTPQMLVQSWITGLVAAGVAAAHAKTYNTKYPRALPFVIEYPCPHGRRTPDRYDVAKVRLIIEDNGWWSLDPASPCPECTFEHVRRWLLTCPRCVADEDSERHYPDHGALDLFGGPYDLSRIDYTGKPDDFAYDDSRGFDRSPLAWIMQAFAHQLNEAEARWWVEHYHEAAAELRASLRLSEDDAEPYVRRTLASAQRALGAGPKRAIKTPQAPKMTPEEAAEWIDRLVDLDGNPLVDPSLGEKATWNIVRSIAGRPVQPLVFEAVKIRKGRATEP